MRNSIGVIESVGPGERKTLQHQVSFKLMGLFTSGKNAFSLDSFTGKNCFFRFSQFFPGNESKEKTFLPDVNSPIKKLGAEPFS